MKASERSNISVSTYSGNMPDDKGSGRTFFSLRYALPGYTFLFILILVAYPELSRIFLDSEQINVIVALLGFITLLGGGALGFLISQVWYVFFNRFLFGYYGEFSKARELLEKKYDLTDSKNHQLFFLDYLHRHASEKLQIYTQRRFDLMHICGSAFVATAVGLIFGLFVRFNPSSAGTIWKDVSLCLPELLLHEMLLYDVGVILIVGILLVLLFFGTWHAGRQHAMGAHLSIREALHLRGFPVWEAKMIFQSEYFDGSAKDRRTFLRKALQFKFSRNFLRFIFLIVILFSMLALLILGRG